MAALARNGNRFATAKVGACQRFFVGNNVSRRALRNHVSAVFACARAHVNHPIGNAYRVFVVFYNQHGITKIAQLLQRANKAHVVALMQTDRRLIKNVQHAHKPSSNLRCQANALRFTTRER